MTSTAIHKITVGSVEWANKENELATSFVKDALEDFAYSTRNDLDWLNEYMIRAVSEPNNLASILQTPAAKKRAPLNELNTSSKLNSPEKRRDFLTDLSEIPKVPLSTKKSLMTPETSFHSAIEPLDSPLKLRHNALPKSKVATLAKHVSQKPSQTKLSGVAAGNLSSSNKTNKLKEGTTGSLAPPPSTLPRPVASVPQLPTAHARSPTVPKGATVYSAKQATDQTDQRIISSGVTSVFRRAKNMFFDNNQHTALPSSSSTLQKEPHVTSRVPSLKRTFTFGRNHSPAVTKPDLSTKHPTTIMNQDKLRAPVIPQRPKRPDETLLSQQRLALPADKSTRKPVVANMAASTKSNKTESSTESSNTKNIPKSATVTATAVRDHVAPFAKGSHLHKPTAASAAKITAPSSSISSSSSSSTSSRVLRSQNPVKAAPGNPSLMAGTKRSSHQALKDESVFDTPVRKISRSGGKENSLVKSTLLQQAGKQLPPVEGIKFSNDKIAFASVPKFASKPIKLQIKKTAAVAQHKPKSVLPEIHSDSEDDSTLESWANSPELKSSLMAQRFMNPDSVFGPIPPLQIEEVFGNSKVPVRMRPRSSSAVWNNDKLTQQEIDQYHKEHGYLE